MENIELSPRYHLLLSQKVQDKLWELFDKSKYDNVKDYIYKWHKVDGNRKENFFVHTLTFGGKIDLARTLNNMPSAILLKIAIDLDIETPNYIPAIPIFRNELKNDYTTAQQTFEKALKNVEENPDVAVGLANSALESIIKQILSDERINVEYEKDTLSKLIEKICKAFNFNSEEVPVEIRNIASSLMKVCKSIEDIRSKKSSFHGKMENDYLISDSIYAYFIVNATTTVGLFLLSFYKKNYSIDNNLPF